MAKCRPKTPERLAEEKEWATCDKCRKELGERQLQCVPQDKGRAFWYCPTCFNAEPVDWRHTVEATVKRRASVCVEVWFEAKAFARLQAARQKGCPTPETYVERLVMADLFPEEDGGHA